MNKTQKEQGMHQAPFEGCANKFLFPLLFIVAAILVLVVFFGLVIGLFRDLFNV
ncbi:hypothetical protein [Pontimicrobium aquaticum]|uniref:hypothetical protein n=1 Tax=Pontimicrobium aquaticum TaxID=2565367 RepID=UPI00145CD1A5|nr:hypothetical protein [Pontimicrobium aquaticum]